MKFYRLVKFSYDTDREDDLYNPVRVHNNYWIPSIICEKCSTWSGSDKIFKPFTEEQLEPFLDGGFIEYEKWKKLSIEWAKKLEIDISCIQPGADLGFPTVELLSENYCDFIHYFPGRMLVTEKVVETIVSISATGVEFIKITPVWSKKSKCKDKPLPTLWILDVAGSAWRVGVTEEKMRVCDICPRTKFLAKKMLIDEERWDGSDFFHLENNPNMVFVTEKIVNALEKAKLTNYSCELLKPYKDLVP